ncbi:MAG: hypothetical protein ACI4HL_03965 [Ruminococcus sp.]
MDDNDISISNNELEYLADDYATNERLQPYLSDFLASNFEINLAQPNKTINLNATKAYTVNGLPKKRHIQKSYVGSTYIYVSQSVGTDTYLSRYTINGTTATYKDHMVLNGFGHNQTLEVYNHNGKTYILIGCKANPDPKWDTSYFTMQVGRIQYSPGATISSYSNISRLARLDCANTTATPFDTIDTNSSDYIDGEVTNVVMRMDAALSSDKTKLVLAVRSIYGKIQYSYYNFNTINNLLDSVDGESVNYISCANNTSIKNACYFSCVQTGNQRVLPNSSCQGIDFTNAYSVYIAGGVGGQQPKIAKMIKNNSGGYTYSYCINVTNTISGELPEIEGIQNATDYLYFVLCPSTKSTSECIYSLDKSVIDEAVGAI